MNIYEIKDLSHTYNKGEQNSCTALSDINLNIADGELMAIVGTSGSGKSTLLHILGGLIAPTSGQVVFDSKPLKFKSISKMAEYRNKSIGFVLQSFGLLMTDNVLDNVCIPLLIGGVNITAAKKRAAEALKLVGLEKMLHKKANQLSGGQKQRVAIARAIVNNPRVILADEPTGALDSKTSSEIMDLFEAINKDGKTVIIVTHDEHIAARADTIVKIEDGAVTG